MEGFFKGDISITDNVNLVRDIIFSNTPNIKIITLEEDGILPLNHPNVIKGTCILPPVEALIAEADGDENLFDTIYSDYFNTPFMFEFISALMISLYNGNNIVFYYYELDGNNVIPKLRQHMFQRYGIYIGVLGTRDICKYDNRCLPIWLSHTFMINGITAREFLINYPPNLNIPQNIMDKIIIDMNPYGNLQEKEKYIYSLVIKLKEHPNLKIAIC